MNNKQLIWNYCINAGMTEAGAAGMMGNIQAESAFMPNNVENRCPLSDEAYTILVDSNPDYDFAKDNYGYFGYGLCQWTYYTRKIALRAFARERGVSISDIRMQLDFMMQELTTQYPQVWSVLSATDDIRKASDIVMTDYENPADQSERAKTGRYIKAVECFNLYSGTKAEPEVEYVYRDVKVPELYAGMTHRAVGVVQAILFTAGYFTGSIGRNFMDEYTVNAIKAYQADHNLDPDGIVGKLTWSSLLGN